IKQRKVIEQWLENFRKRAAPTPAHIAPPRLESPIIPLPATFLQNTSRAATRNLNTFRSTKWTRARTSRKATSKMSYNSKTWAKNSDCGGPYPDAPKGNTARPQNFTGEYISDVKWRGGNLPSGKENPQIAPGPQGFRPELPKPS